MLDDTTRELSFEELEAKYAESYREIFDESSFMDEADLDVLLSKEEKGGPGAVEALYHQYAWAQRGYPWL